MTNQNIQEKSSKQFGSLYHRKKRKRRIKRKDSLEVKKMPIHKANVSIQLFSKMSLQYPKASSRSFSSCSKKVKKERKKICIDLSDLSLHPPSEIKPYFNPSPYSPCTLR
eukprot:TRINITY_DN65708_c0_g1_i1.p3 TRINITY_DN65708_c0_g1~~TRINITY_DN65708_c0_g1_i1.p3  ORF type:complete len:110 (+),score=12.26 TRINITY_DN65708_c0_g1_i1:572-901(+)